MFTTDDFNTYTTLFSNRDGAIYYKNTNIFEYVWRRLVNQGNINISELFKDRTQISFSKDLTMGRFIEILTSFIDQSINPNTTKELGLTLDDIFGEEDYITEEELADGEYSSDGEDEFDKPEDDGANREIYDIGCCIEGESFLCGSGFEYVEMAELNAALDAVASYKHMNYRLLREIDKFKNLDWDDLFGDDCDENYAEDHEVYDKDEELINGLFGDDCNETYDEYYDEDEELINELFGDEDDDPDDPDEDF